MAHRGRGRTIVVGITAAAAMLSSIGVIAAPGTGLRATASDEARAVTELDRSTSWELVDTLELDFDAFHPQGMTIVEDRIYLSSVEILEPTVRYPEPRDGYDRSAGKGQGHVFVLDLQGSLLEDVELGEGDIYHPGGIDFDGEQIWVPVAQYRPDSASIVYSIDPQTLEVTEELRHDDHVGGVVVDQVNGWVHGVSWGSRTEFAWNRQGRLVEQRANQSHFIDYQDCEHTDRRLQICGGVTGFSGGSVQGELGGLALKDLRTGEILHEVPITLASDEGHALTRNPVAVEADAESIRLYGAPDDDETVEILIYEAQR